MKKFNFTHRGFYTSGIIIISFFFSSHLFAQAIEITPSYGYQFGTKLNYGPNYIKVTDSDQWGVTLGFETYDDFMIELSYTRQQAEINIRDIIISPFENRMADISADWIMV
jgi:hypothetical protein